MKDPVALAYSGRIDEARAAALEQAASDDDYLATQGLEALAVLGQQHGLRAGAEVDRALARGAARGGAAARAALQAAAAMESRAVEDAVAAGLESGAATWEMLRYAGELPSLRLARALAAGWRALPARLRDEALLVSCVLPAADRLEADGWGARAQDAARDESEEVRLAAVIALGVWRPADAAVVLGEALEDAVAAVRKAAVEALVQIDLGLLQKRAAALGDRCPEALPYAAPEPEKAAAKPAAKKPAGKPRR